ncbi:MAG: DNA repair protein RadA, partial [Lachnospiraceae bacterium]|nr:DNA repair protein RadA [Lachnospiraceae bacterium]
MAKAKTTVFFCQNCGYESSKWMGQCPACKEWNSFVEERVTKTNKEVRARVRECVALPINEVQSEEHN